MIDMYAIVPILLISIFGLIAFKDWGEMELDWQAKKFKIKRRQTEYLLQNNLNNPAETSSPRKLPKE
jgi:hypothetical protein